LTEARGVVGYLIMPAAKKKTARRSRVPVPIRAIDFVMYCAKDMRHTRDFYRQLFGLKRGHEWNDFWSEFDTSPVTLCLNGPSTRKDPMWDWNGPACVGFAVDDVRVAVETCRQRKVKVLHGPVETSVCWMAWIEDPDGNRICLHSRKNGTAG
jgi:predicted enzyme related to lactoylglutathione lyase